MDNRILPHSLTSEQAVIGALLIDPKAITRVADSLKPDQFYAPEHRIIYEAAVELDESGKTVDLVNVAGRLQERNQLEDIGGVKYLSGLSRSVPTAANIEEYADTVRDRYLQRETIVSLERQLAAAWEAETGYEAATGVQSVANVLSDKAVKSRDFRDMKELGISAFDLLEQRFANSGNEVTGIPSGYIYLDRMTSGFQNSDLIIVAARPSVGKTTFALNIVQSAAIIAKKTVALFSLEVSGEQLTLKMMSAEQMIDSNRIRTGFLRSEDWDKAASAVSILSDTKIFVDDSASITVSEIINKCRRLKDKVGLDMVVIDYLQLISADRTRDNRQQEVSEISRKLKQLARELDVPVIALSQLSRAVEQRQDKRPMMSDLRESGSIEQDADIVAFLYRDDYYNQESEKKNIIEIIIAKQRNGPVGTVELVFMKDYNKFLNYERQHVS
ncbi:replicative DNA helicase [Paenibacillus sp. 3LSP]|uniref:replicative DNA helicase n=1 Tax=Paenibacillus sp. 3LSP TaxID=2800795 RepID=UPI0028FD350F|nr:replicative DNA helicase [Paenibacillus sp. 3LSP]MDU0332555.1 replicative DNA helicase [Paenibacillus sp. 3LSP]